MNLAKFRITFALHGWLLFAIGLTLAQQPQAFADEPNPPEFELVEPTSSSNNAEITDYSEIIENADIQSTNDNAIYDKIDRELNSAVNNVIDNIFGDLFGGLNDFLGGLEDTVGDFVNSKIPDIGKIIDIIFNSEVGEGETDLPSRQQSETLEGNPDCLNNTIPQIDQIVEEAEAQNSGALAVLENYKDKIKGAILNIAAVGQIILAPQKIVLTTLVHALLIAVQLAFNMIIEIALLLHSLLAPIAVILTLIPTGQRYISIWLTWFAAIAAIQVCYTIIIGLAATAIVLSNAQLFSDITFLVLAAFFGPGLAYAMSKGGGTALYQSINSGVDKSISFGTEVVSKAVLLVL